ncbi:MAG: AI-2E family transporter [Pseudomonadota bacterium]|nr:AI-2E family transporter [Pseudomonadota bacterium]
MKISGLRTAMYQQRALGWLAAAAVVAILWLARPFASALLLGGLMAFTLEPVYALLARRTGKPFLASLATVLTSVVLLVGALSGFVTLFVTRAAAFSIVVREQLHAGGQLNAWLVAISGWLGHLGISTTSLTARLEAGAGQIASKFAATASALATGAFSVLLGLFFAALAMHLVLLYWRRMVDEMVQLSPLRPEHTKSLLHEFRRVGRTTVFGTIVTGLSQGLLATLGFLISGVPQPIFFGIATALASLIPAVGTLLVWIPAGLYLLASGHSTRGIIELAWGALIVVGFSDYVIRPRLVGDDAVPTMLVFIALFGGIEAFGLPGLIIGPVLMAMSIAALRLYAHDENRERAVT